MANGLTEQELGIYIDVLMNGRKIGEYQPDVEKAMDLIVNSGHKDNITPETLLDSEITNAYGELVQLRDLVDLEYGQGMTQIDHLERNRNIRLQVTPPDDVPLQTAMELVSEDLVPKLRQQGGLEGVRISTGGNFAPFS